MKTNRSIEMLGDEDLVALAMEGREDAYRALFDRHFPAAFRKALYYTGRDGDEAKDVCQEAFIAAFDNLATLEEGGKFKPWLMKIVKNTALNRLEKKNRLAEFPLFMEPEGHDGETPDEKDAREAESAAIRVIIDTIPDESARRTVKMFYLEGLGTEEIAQKLGVTQTAVTTRLARFRARYGKRIMIRILKLRGLE